MCRQYLALTLTGGQTCWIWAHLCVLAWSDDKCVTAAALTRHCKGLSISVLRSPHYCWQQISIIQARKYISLKCKTKSQPCFSFFAVRNDPEVAVENVPWRDKRRAAPPSTAHGCNNRIEWLKCKRGFTEDFTDRLKKKEKRQKVYFKVPYN